MKKPEISLGRAAGEFTVIVLGVLVALGVDRLNTDGLFEHKEGPCVRSP